MDTHIKLFAAFLGIMALLFIFILMSGLASILSPVEYSHEIPVIDKLNNTIVLRENRSAIDPTWTTLVHFLQGDDTKYIRYNYPNFTCADFSQRLHDDAESLGIRAGLVVINYTTRGINADWYLGNSTILIVQPPTGNHAIVAFNTTDRGLVFIDDTNTNQEFIITDKVAYLRDGTEYGLLPMGMANNLSYSYYSNISARYLSYLEQLNSYNIEVANYNNEVNRFDLMNNASYETYLTLNSEKNKLDNEKASFARMEESRWTLYCPIGIVNYYKIFW